jgi:hypothetical protein
LVHTVPEEHRRKLKSIAKKKVKALRGGLKTTVFVEDSDLIGIIAEYGFAVTFGYKMRIDYKRKSDGGYDFLCGRPPGQKRLRIDVKGTSSEKILAPLLVKRENLRADIYCLVRVSVADWTYQFIGWASAWGVERAEKTDPPVTIASNYRINSDGLIEIEKILKYVNRKRQLKLSEL